jgi:simple sugar transport system ATP-binding protein
MRGISKSFASVKANVDVSFSVEAGEIHALLGENGSGKSTLMNILSGIYLPDAGEIDIHGERVVFRSPRDSIARGIGMIHQHFQLVENLSALDNIIAGTGHGLFLDRAAARARIMALSEQFAMGIDPDRRISTMSVSEKQTVEILKVLYRGSRILILDEPTAVLTPQEITRLFHILHRMRENGQAVVFISHKLHEVLSLCDRVTVLRQGRTIGTVRTDQTCAAELVSEHDGRPRARRDLSTSDRCSRVPACAFRSEI